MKQRIKEKRMVIILVFLSVLFAFAFQFKGMKEYNRYSSDTLNYERGKVVDIISEQLEYDEDLQIYLGSQKLKVELLAKDYKGQKIEVTNYLTKTHNVFAQNGTSLIINVDDPENLDAYYTVYNYDRSFSMLTCAGILMLAIITIGKGKGIKAILGLLYSLFIIVYLLLPTVFSGYSPVFMSIIVAILSTAVTLLLLNGESKKTFAAIISTTIGVFISFIFFLIVSNLLHIDGFSTSEAESLLLINKATGIQVKDILYAGVLISSLGAIMDVGMSIVSSLYEVYRHNSLLSAKALFYSGIEIGKDMIGTMSNTLILAFTGSAFVTLLVFISYQVQFNQLINSNFLTIEIAQGICGTFGIVLTVPIASLVAAIFLTRDINIFKNYDCEKGKLVNEDNES